MRPLIAVVIFGTVVALLVAIFGADQASREDELANSITSWVQKKSSR